MTTNKNISLKQQIFENHYNYYSNIGIETIKQQSGQVEQVSSDYQGRVIFELLQNAFDKAINKITVQVLGNSLYVANDGTKFNYVSNYDYKNGTSNRGDFQSLCSISTSTKTVSKNIGNKGVGFKSVFSVAKENYVNVYTKGEIQSNIENTIENISFRIYDSFNDASILPIEFDDKIINNIASKIELVQRERRDRGIPGYYFPLHIEKESEVVEELFKKGFVTIIEIPLNDKKEIKKLFDDIVNVHFEFIRLKFLKFPTIFKLDFYYDKNLTSKSINKSNRKLVSAKIDNELIKAIAKDAGINVDMPQVAFLVKDKPTGMLYNYFPTQVKSPFKYVDFHGDFHTTVDRKSINFEGKIGEYNKAILKGCIELYFSSINNTLAENLKANLSFDLIDQYSIRGKIYKWNWNCLITQDTAEKDKIFLMITNTLKITNWNYDTASLFFGNLAKTYFEKKHSTIEHILFFKATSEFIYNYASNSIQFTIWVTRFKTRFAEILKSLEINVIPEVELKDGKELIYRKASKGNFPLPNFLAINITDFEIEDKIFKSVLGIKDFTDNNELLKYFKQCTFSGYYSKNIITEDKQKELIKSAYHFFESRNEYNFLSTHRFTKAINVSSRDTNSTLNQANFNVSTIFLKTKTGKFKPAQLCLSAELDDDFINCCISLIKKEDFLKFLGVSLDSEYLFTDVRLYESLGNGLDFIPMLIDRQQHKEDISSELIKNVHCISSKGKKIHPSTINNNDYKFLDKISKNSLREELDNLLVRKYTLFPKEYIKILRERIESNFNSKSEIIRLYQSLFTMFEKAGHYLVINNDHLYWNDKQDFIIVSSKLDFDLCTTIPNKNVLCYFNTQILPAYLHKLVVRGRRENIMIEDKVRNDEIKIELEKKLIFILLSISYSKNSEVNFLDDEKDLVDVQSRLESLSIFEGINLKQNVYFNSDIVISNKKYAYEGKKSEELYFDRNCSKSEIACGVSDFIFNNVSIAESLELILFHKTTNDLKMAYDYNDIGVIQKKWKKDYNFKYAAFQKNIFESFSNEEVRDLKWYVYNSYHKSKFLIEVDSRNLLEQLQECILIQKSQKEFDGYFDTFQLEIDYDDIYIRIAKIKIQLDLIEDLSKEGIQNDLEKLSIKLGCESEIKNIEEKLNALNKISDFAIDNHSIVKKTKELALQNRIETIFNSMNSSLVKATEINAFGGLAKSIPLPAKVKKNIFQNSEVNDDKSVELEIMGSTGEERVLYYFIEDFLKLKKNERITGIESVYNLLVQKLKNYPMEKYKQKCIETVTNDEDLRKALIPLFYVTMHHKYAYFDLIVYKDFNPTLIEVKTTYSENNNKFFLSIAEVDAARGKDKYEIVRDTPTSLIFLGNPIKLVEDNIAIIVGTNFSLTPRNYEFRFTKEPATTTITSPLLKT